MQDQRDEAVPGGPRGPRPPGRRVARGRRRRSHLRALVLDAYGTLLHYERERLLPVFEAVAREHGLPVEAQALFDRWTEHEGDFRRRRIFLKDGRWEAAEPFLSYQEAWAACFRAAFADLGLSGGPDKEAVGLMVADLRVRDAYQEVPQALEALRSLVPVALLSNADAAFLFGALEHNGLTFETIVYSEEERVYKPHPRIFQRVLERLEAEPHEVLYVGDSPAEDVVGATAVGIPAVWVNRASADWPLPDDALPAHEVPDLLALVDVATSRSHVLS